MAARDRAPQQTSPASLVTARMRELWGEWFADRTAPPVAVSDVRRRAIAVCRPEPAPPLFWDDAYASETRRGGIGADPVVRERGRCDVRCAMDRRHLPDVSDTMRHSR